jgi:hypothetical protein
MNKRLLLPLLLVCSIGIMHAQQNKLGKQKLTLSTAQPMDPAKRSPSLQNLKYVNLSTKAKLKSSSVPLFSEDFDGISGATSGGSGTYTFAPNFLLRNVDGLTPTGTVSYVNEAWERREDFANAVTDSAAFSTSWYSPAGTANDWMWTPLISGITSITTLSWNAVTYDASYPDGYEVRIMTSTQGPPTGGTSAIGNQITNSTQVFSIAAENTTWTNRSISLAAYAGQSVYVGFRNNSNDKFLLLIDDIILDNPVTTDAQVIKVDTVSEYTKIPLTQKTNLNLGGVIRNTGGSALTNVALRVNVYNSANAIVTTATSTSVASIAPLTQSTFTIPNVSLPNTADTYTFKFFPVLGAPQVDQVPANDTLAWAAPFEYTSFTYARDNGVVASGLGIGAGNGGFLGQNFNLSNADNLKSVTVSYTKGYTGKKHAAVVYSTLANGTPNAIIGYTDTLLYPDDSARTYSLPMKGGNLALAAGNYVIAAIEFDSTLQLANTNNIFTPGRIWVNWPTSPSGGWANVEAFGANFAKPFFLRPVFGIPIIAGDNVCSAITLSVGSNGPYRHDLATVQANEVKPPSGSTPGGQSQGWYNDGTGLTNTMWFKFTATTKKVRIATNWDGEFDDDTQLALWKVNNTCSDLLDSTKATLLAANDDSSSTYFGSVITGATLCLVPGTTYYVQVDAYRSNLGPNVGDSLYVIFQNISDIAPSTGLNAAYCVSSSAITLAGTPSGGAFTVNGTSNTTYTPSTVGTDTIKYTVGSCFTTTQAVTVNALPIVTASSSASSVCAGSNVTLNGGGAATYTWNNGATNGVAFAPASTNTYTVTGTDANGCSGTASTTVTVNALPTVSVSAPTTTLCTGTPVTLTGTPAGGVYSVAFGNPASLTGNIFNAPSTGSYNIAYTYTDANGCSDSASVSFNVNCVLGINALNNGNIIMTVNPNPTNGLVNVEILNAKIDKVTLKVLSLSGQLLDTIEYNGKRTIDLSKYASGMYYLNVSNEQFNKTIKLVKE